LVRYNSDGSLDNSFDIDGKVTTVFGNNNDVCYAAALQADGKIILAGKYFNTTSTYSEVALARYNNDPVGIEENNINEYFILLYPNPATHAFSLNGTKANGEIKIYNIEGREVLSVESMDSQTTINTERFSPGFYLVKYSDGKITVSVKLIQL
jgi:hypothetical protein